MGVEITRKCLFFTGKIGGIVRIVIASVSEAIHFWGRGALDCFVAGAPRNDGGGGILISSFGRFEGGGVGHILHERAEEIALEPKNGAEFAQLAAAEIMFAGVLGGSRLPGFGARPRRFGPRPVAAAQRRLFHPFLGRPISHGEYSRKLFLISQEDGLFNKRQAISSVPQRVAKVSETINQLLEELCDP
jgi:hypothetical protein